MRKINRATRIGMVWLITLSIFVINSLTLMNVSAETSSLENTINYFVSPTGNDNNPGTESLPFATIQKAKDIIKSTMPQENVNVIFRGGEYYLSSTLVFDQEDSGNGSNKITYKNYPGEEPIINGGTAITGWQVHSGQIYKANVGTGWNFSTLYENGVRSVIARSPNTGYNHAIAVTENNTISNTKFKFNTNELPNIVNKDNLEVCIWAGGSDGTWNWGTDLLKVKSLDFTQRIIELNSPASYQLGTGSRYYVQGALELLDSPGEFYLDKANGILYYWPRNSAINQQLIVAPKTKDIIEFKGASSSNLAENITFEGITIRCSDRGGNGIHMENAENITIKDCKINGTGENGVHITGWAQNNTLYGNSVYDIGNTGISIGGNEQYINKKNIISNNHIYNTGRLVGHGSGIQLWQSGENTITNNLIHDTPRYAISLKGPNPANLIGQTIDGVLVTTENQRDFRSTQDNYIAYNDVSRANTDSQDTGVIETWCPDTGNVISNNYIHDSEIPFSFGTALYFDDATDGITAMDNIFYNLQQNGQGKLESIIFCKGVGNQLINNIAVNNNIDRGTIHTQEAYGHQNREITSKQNIFYNSGDNLYSFDNWADNRYTYSDYNLLFNSNGVYGIRGLEQQNVTTFNDWKNILNQKYDQNSRTTDPLFVDISQGDLRLRYDSPAYSLGIHDIDMEGIGLKNDFKYADTNEPLARVFVKREGDSKDSANILLTAGEQTNLKVSGRSTTGYVSDISSANISFVSDMPGVATINNTGAITAIGSGVANITVTVQKGNVTKSKDMFVIVTGSAGSGTQSWKLQNYNNAQGTVTYTSNGFNITGNGENIYGAEDDFTYVYKNLNVADAQSEVSISAKINSLQDIGKPDAAVGVMIRDNSIAGSNNVMMRILPSGGLRMTYRNAENPTSWYIVGQDITYPAELKLTKLGNLFTGYYKQGSDWIKVGEITAQMDIEILAGVGLMANGQGLYTSCSLSDVTIVGGEQSWQLQNYKNAQGTVTYTNNGFNITGNGENIWGAEDDFTYVYKNVNVADAQSEVSISSKINSLQDIGKPDAAVGVMLRDNSIAGSNNVMLRILPGGGLRMTYRNAENPTSWFIAGPDIPYPAELKLTKLGNLFTGYYKQGSDWIEVGEITAEMDIEILAGVGLMANGLGQNINCSLSDVAIVGGEQSWQLQNFKNAQGTVTYTSNGFNLTGNGENIWGAEDDFTYVYKNVNAADAQSEISISAKINSLQDIGKPDAAVGVMFRDNSIAGSNNVMLRILPGGGLRMTYRNAANPTSGFIASPDILYPAELKLTKVGNLFTGYYKQGSVWIKVGEIIAEMDNEILVGVGLMANGQGNYIETSVSDIKIDK